MTVNDHVIELLNTHTPSLVREAVFMASALGRMPTLSVVEATLMDLAEIGADEAKRRIDQALREGLLEAKLSETCEWELSLSEGPRRLVHARFGYSRLRHFIERGLSAEGQLVLRSVGSARRALDLFESRPGSQGLGCQFMELLDVDEKAALCCVYYIAYPQSPLYKRDHEGLSHAYMIKRCLKWHGLPFPSTGEDWAV